MKAPSEKHLENWIVDHIKQFGDIWEDAIDAPEYAYEGMIWLNETDVIAPFFSQILARQLHLPSGIPDIIAANHNHVAVVELKKGAITYETVGQCLRYMYDLREIYFEIFFEELQGGLDYQPLIHIENKSEYPDEAITGMIVGSHLEDKNIPLICTQCDIKVVTYDFDGGEYWFEHQLVASKGTTQDYQDYTLGTIGQAIRNVLKSRADSFLRHRGLIS